MPTGADENAQENELEAALAGAGDPPQSKAMGKLAAPPTVNFGEAVVNSGLEADAAKRRVGAIK